MKKNKIQHTDVIVENSISGTVTAQTCDCCGHHEIGISTADGRFIAFKPGQKVTIHPHSERK